MSSRIRNQAKPASVALAAGLAGAVFTFGTALADSPHFIRCALALETETTTFGHGKNQFELVTGATLVATWKEAGLGDNVLIEYLAEADATAEWACINNGGNFPQDPKKQTVEGPVSAEGTFSSGKNGSITASLRVDAPGRDPSPCGGGQADVLLNVSFTGVTVTDETNDITESCGAISETFLTIP